MDNVHVAVQVRRDPYQPQPADASEVSWDVEVDVVGHDGDDQPDFRGPAVQGKRGERFVYLTWGHIGPEGDDAAAFEMFRRAKLMLNRVESTIMADAIEAGQLFARIDMTDDSGGPRCARVDPPAVEWSARRP